MRSPGRAVSTLAAGLVAAALLATPPARAEVELTLFLGHAEVLDSDLRLSLPGGTDLELEEVSWDDASFDSPLYYAVRGTWWLPRSPEWGFALDLTHAKAILDVDERVAARGRRNGVPVAGTIFVEQAIDAFEMSHGLNTLTLSGMRRWGGFGGGWNRVTYFAGLGGGVAVPHVEARVGGLEIDEYQVAGPALQGVLGLDTAVDEHLGITLEGRVSWVDVEADLTGGGTAQTELWLLQLVAGLSLRD